MHVRGWHVVLLVRSDTIIQQASPPAGVHTTSRDPHSGPESWASPHPQPRLSKVLPPDPWDAGGRSPRQKAGDQLGAEVTWPSRGRAEAWGPTWGALAGTSNSPQVTHTAALLVPVEEQSHLSFLLLLEIIIFRYKSYLLVKGQGPQKCRREKMKALFHLSPQLLLPPRVRS